MKNRKAAKVDVVAKAEADTAEANATITLANARVAVADARAAKAKALVAEAKAEAAEAELNAFRQATKAAKDVMSKMDIKSQMDKIMQAHMDLMKQHLIAEMETRGIPKDAVDAEKYRALKKGTEKFRVVKNDAYEPIDAEQAKFDEEMQRSYHC